MYVGGDLEIVSAERKKEESGRARLAWRNLGSIGKRESYALKICDDAVHLLV